MKTILYLLSLQLVLTIPSLAQSPITITHGEDSKGNITFTCTNHAYCNYVVQVEFPTLENGKASEQLPFEGEVKPGTTRLLTLYPINAKDPIRFSFKTNYAKGCLIPSIDTGFTYLLPIAPGKTAQAYVIDNTTTNGSGIPGGSYSIRLRMHPGDTIYAARRGIVTEVDTHSSQNDQGVVSTEGWNDIEIVQADCSFAQYGIIKKDGAFVKPGQTVEAGMPLGIVGGDKFGRGSEIRFAVSYFHDHITSSVPLEFWTKRNGKGLLKHGATYTSEYPANLLSQEKPKAKSKAGAGKTGAGKTKKS